MSIYVDKVHIYCDHEDCDNNVMIEAEELGSYDFSHPPRGLRNPPYGSVESIGDVISDFAFTLGWGIDNNSKVFCPTHDKE